MNTQIRPAATVILMREGTDTFEIFMVKRSMKSSFGSLYVFPGGTLDDEDSLPEMYQHCDSLSDDQASSKLALVGDVIFNGSIGRTDLPRGNHQDLIDSISQKLWKLGNDVEFVCGHGPNSTFGQERVSNPFVSDTALS